MKGVTVIASVAVVGAGYVGCAVAAGLAEFGHCVALLERSVEKVVALNAGFSPVYDRALSKALLHGLQEGRITVTRHPGEAIPGREAIFICLGTPADELGDADLSALHALCDEIPPLVTPGALVVVKSTVPVGALEWVTAAFRTDPATGTAVVCNPEFLREGSALEDFFHPDRIVIGADDPADAERLMRYYARMEAPLVVTDPRSAQLIKYGANALLAMKISFINAMARLCEAVGADVADVSLGVGLDRGVNPAYLGAGVGFGGPCLPKDLQCLIRSGERAGVPMELFVECLEVNRAMAAHARGTLSRQLGGLKGRRIGLWGLAFKPGTADLRDSPAIALARELLDAGAEVTSYDPVGSLGPPPDCPGLELAPDMWAAAEGREALVVGTDWPEFRSADLTQVVTRLARPVLYDGRRIFSPAAAARVGLTYLGVGYGRHAPVALATERDG